MRKLIWCFSFLFLTCSATAQIELKFKENQSVTYDEAIRLYTYLDTKHEKGKLIVCGKTDVGRPLHLFVMSEDGNSDPETARSNNKSIILINNGIHPGEPCGIDASLQFANDILTAKKGMDKLLKNTVICIIPVYNIGGALNRGESRVNQNGPDEYGFRGNYQNLDLNRDFIKCDSENARSFIEIYQKWKPDVFIDLHTTDGFDFQYTMSLIPTQPNKMHPILGSYMRGEFLPAIYEEMKKSNHEITPYVYAYKKALDDGIKDFHDSPRYSSGYANLFNSFGFIAEAHKFKPFADRVAYSYELLKVIAKYTNQESNAIFERREEANKAEKQQKSYHLNYTLDTSKWDNISFKGINFDSVVSPISGLKIKAYNNDAPWEKPLRYYSYYKPTVTISKPDYYFVPQAYKDVIHLLKINGVQFTRLTSDSLVKGEVTYIDHFDTKRTPYEKHYLHSNVKIKNLTGSIQYYKGDFLIKTGQPADRFIVEVLEPQSVDSYFCWNFFDNILNRKEYFSDFAFEKTAQELLKINPALKDLLTKELAENKALANSHWQQLDFIYSHSEYFEKSFNRYPIIRVLE